MNHWSRAGRIEVESLIDPPKVVGVPGAGKLLQGGTAGRRRRKIWIPCIYTFTAVYVPYSKTDREAAGRRTRPTDRFDQPKLSSSLTGQGVVRATTGLDNWSEIIPRGVSDTQTLQ